MKYSTTVFIFFASVLNSAGAEVICGQIASEHKSDSIRMLTLEERVKALSIDELKQLENDYTQRLSRLDTIVTSRELLQTGKPPAPAPSKPDLTAYLSTQGRLSNEIFASSLWPNDLRGSALYREANDLVYDQIRQAAGQFEQTAPGSRLRLLARAVLEIAAFHSQLLSAMAYAGIEGGQGVLSRNPITLIDSETPLRARFLGILRERDRSLQAYIESVVGTPGLAKNADDALAVANSVSEEYDRKIWETPITVAAFGLGGYALFGGCKGLLRKLSLYAKAKNPTYAAFTEQHPRLAYTTPRLLMFAVMAYFGGKMGSEVGAQIAESRLAPLQPTEWDAEIGQIISFHKNGHKDSLTVATYYQELKTVQDQPLLTAMKTLVPQEVQQRWGTLEQARRHNRAILNAIQKELQSR